MEEVALSLNPCLSSGGAWPVPALTVPDSLPLQRPFRPTTWKPSPWRKARHSL